MKPTTPAMTPIKMNGMGDEVHCGHSFMDDLRKQWGGGPSAFYLSALWITDEG